MIICLELGVCSKERVDVRYVRFFEYVDTSVQALNVHVVFFLACHSQV